MLNKGKIIRAGRANLAEDEVTTVSLLVTSEMVPAFRFVVYSILSLPYMVEVVADSIFVNVESHCLGSVSQFAIQSLMLCLLRSHSVLRTENETLGGVQF